jgi:hypothetical protein
VVWASTERERSPAAVRGLAVPDDVHEDPEIVSIEVEIVPIEVEIVSIEVEIVSIEVEIVSIEVEIVSIEVQIVPIEVEIVSIEMEIVPIEVEIVHFEVDAVRIDPCLEEPVLWIRASYNTESSKVSYEGQEKSVLQNTNVAQCDTFDPSWSFTKKSAGHARIWV